MTEIKRETNLLPIPANCSPIEYVIEGFTMVELSYVGIVGMIAFIIGGILFFRSENPLPVIIYHHFSDRRRSCIFPEGPVHREHD